MLTLNFLRTILNYNPDTGNFTWLKPLSPRVRVGEIAGSPDKDGYTCIQVKGKKYKAGRLAWVWMTGEWPSHEIDHRDGCPSNDAWSNLREATRVDNICNSNRGVGETGLRGVKFNPRTSSWYARIGHGCQRRHLGTFSTAEEAYKAYLAAAEEIHGEFALHNRKLQLKESEKWQQ